MKGEEEDERDHDMGGDEGKQVKKGKDEREGKEDMEGENE